MSLSVALLLALFALMIGALAGFLVASRRHEPTAQALTLAQHSSQGEALARARAEEAVSQLQHRLNDLQQALANAEQQKLQRDQELRRLDSLLTEQQTRLAAAQEQLTAERQLLQQADQQFSLRFENLAQKIFEEKSRRFTEQNQTGLDGLLRPLREQLKDFHDKVDKAYATESGERAVLKEHLARLERLNQQISDDAVNLTRALKGDRKLQGNWGELILEKVLEESGLRRGHEYETQVSTSNEDGQRLIPDVIIRLPENRDIVIDSKVSLVAYERYCSSDDAAERERALRDHVQSLRQHIRGLSDKGYTHLAGVRTLDFVFLFMPVEAAFLLAVEADAELFSEAFSRRIVIVSPTTLLATLRTVASIWQFEKQNRNTEEIVAAAGLLHDKFVGFIDNMKRIGHALNQGQAAYEDAFKQLSEGRGNMIVSVAKLQKLGARTRKQLPADLLEPDAAAGDFNEPNDRSPLP